MILDVIAGARPNFMKIAALFAVADAFPQLSLRFIHTGQHYDAAMSDVFLRELRLPDPIRHLGVGGGSHAVQTAEIMKGYEAWVHDQRPDWTVVVGDVNSTLACSLVAAKLGIRVAHVEAGLRSFDRTMPEEINRLVTDSIADLLFATEPAGVENLAREGHPSSRIKLAGNVMADTLLRLRGQAAATGHAKRLGLTPRAYGYVTLHRPGNVDDPDALGELCRRLTRLAERLPLVFPLHPRTRGRLHEFGLFDEFQRAPGMILLEPVSYLESLSLTMEARLVVTDSGGLQEESAILGVPCLTLRPNTERPITVDCGTNTLIKGDWALFDRRIEEILGAPRADSAKPIPFWDGEAGCRVLSALAAFS